MKARSRVIQHNAQSQQYIEHHFHISLTKWNHFGRMHLFEMHISDTFLLKHNDIQMKIGIGAMYNVPTE